MLVCASCGKGGDNLKTCTACKSVKYCNRDCQISHRPQHKKECRKIAAGLQERKAIISSNGTAKIREKSIISDDELFGDPPAKEECPVCMVSMPFSNHGVCCAKKIYHPCCGKVICNGCMTTANEEMKKGNLKKCCPFCRIPNPSSDEEYIQRVKKRMEQNNDVEAYYELGSLYQSGHFGLPQDLSTAFDLYKKAAELGSSRGHYSTAGMYMCALGVEKDGEKALYHWQLAAIGGDENASNILPTPPRN